MLLFYTVIKLDTRSYKYIITDMSPFQNHFRKTPKITSEIWRKSLKKNPSLKPEMQHFKTN